MSNLRLREHTKYILFRLRLPFHEVMGTLLGFGLNQIKLKKQHNLQYKFENYRVYG